MNHAETLQDMAKGPHQGLSHSAVASLTAGADALDNLADALETLDRVRDALTKIDRNGDAAEEAARASSGAMHSAFERGRVDAYRHTHLLITRALGGTP